MPEQYAIISGSGFTELSGDGERVTIATRFGAPSAAIRTVSLGSQQVLVVPRHGDPHTLPPHAINYRANLSALKELGATHVVALNTVGVISNVREPGEIALPDQVIDYTWGREHTIYDGGGEFEHIEFTTPFASGLGSALLAAAEAVGVDCYAGGVYAATQGPRLESAAEIDRLERDGADYVGMTAMPEAALAQELGLEYACLALIVNRAAGRSDVPIHADVAASSLAARVHTMKVLKQLFA
ncbi:MAG: S-methyl-5'-thioinosine phosphorylase [Woeseiaceae bacterium]